MAAAAGAMPPPEPPGDSDPSRLHTVETPVITGPETCGKCGKRGIKTIELDTTTLKNGTVKWMSWCHDCRGKKTLARSVKRAIDEPDTRPRGRSRKSNTTPSITPSAARSAASRITRPPIPKFFRRGVNPDYSPAQADASRERQNISRAHRAERRGLVEGEEIESTPTTSAILRERAAADTRRREVITISSENVAPSSGVTPQPSQNIPQEQEQEQEQPFEDQLSQRLEHLSQQQSHHTPVRPQTPFGYSSVMSTPSLTPAPQEYFICTFCQKARHRRRRPQNTAYLACIYCVNGTDGFEQFKYCIQGKHEMNMASFVADGVEHKDCNACRHSSTPIIGRRPNINDDTINDNTAPLTEQYALGGRGVSQHAHYGTNPAGQRQRRAQLQAQHYDINRPSKLPVVEGVLDTQALYDPDFELLQNFHTALAACHQQSCSTCNKQWFHLFRDKDGSGNRQGVCYDCQKDTKFLQKQPDLPGLYSAENNMDPGEIPPYLPKLTRVEEQLIARVQVHVQVRQHRGLQFKYTGHVVHFLQNTGKVYNTLPLLPKDLDIVVLKPKQIDERTERQFRKESTVSRKKVLAWLVYLKANHPGYRDIVISQDALTQLPDNNDISDQLLNIIVENETTAAAMEESILNEPGDIDDNESFPLEGAVPNMDADETELSRLRRTVGAQQPAPQLTMPSFRNTPVNEFNSSQALLSWAFPTLFPNGHAEFVTPRLRKVAYPEYVRHLLKYKDGRFQRHEVFRFVAFNTIMRRQVTSRASFFAKKQPQPQHQWTVESIRRAFEDNTEESKALLRSITRHAGALRGTITYWIGKCNGLQAMVRQLSAPSIFATFSFADHHWDDLMKHLPRYNEWKKGSPAQRAKLVRENMRDYPMILSHHFNYRFKTFMKEVLVPRFHVVDFWYRYEWQMRGSAHIHGVFWLNGAPDLEELDHETLQALFLKFWDKHINAMNPQKGRYDLAEHSPLSLHYTEMLNNHELLCSILNRVQLHICTDYYCLRKNKTTELTECRFGAPWPNLTTPELRQEPGRTWLKYMSVRNDETLNQYNALIIMAWMANVDIQPCTGKQGVINYIAKYAAKGEKSSIHFRNLLTKVLPRISGNRPLESMINKVMNRLVGERDISAQEVCHLLLDLPLVVSSRVVQSVDLRPLHEQSAMILIEDDSGARQTTGKKPLEHYLARPETFPDICFLEFLLRYDYKKGILRPKARDRVLNYFHAIRQSKDPEEFARIKLMLHHPFRSFEKLLEFDDQVFTTHAEVYNYCKDHCEHSPDWIDEDPPPPEADSHEPGPEESDSEEHVEEAWMDIARLRPGGNDKITELVNSEDLGNRPADRGYDWNSHIGHIPELVAPGDWLELMKEKYPADVTLNIKSRYHLLNKEQKTFFDFLIQHYQDVLNEKNPQQILLHLDGPGGTGKTFTIEQVCGAMEKLAQNKGAHNPVLRAAPTGVAAHGIGGRTLHSLFRFGVKSRTYIPLAPAALGNLQGIFDAIVYLIIDEKSMVGLKFLAWLHARMKEVRPDSSRPFGGLHIILCGDFYQLAPIGERALYNDTRELNDLEDVIGQGLYHQFHRTIRLVEPMRQMGDSERQFREVLQHLRDGNVTIEDWNLLSTRVRTLLSVDEVESFKTCLHIYSRKSKVAEHCHIALRDCGNPVIKLDAVHNVDEAKSATDDEAGNLMVEIPVAIGSRLMLTSNLWTERGLVNGAMGTLQDIVWATTVANARKEAALALLIRFDKYSGPTINGLVPIFKARRDWYRGVKHCSRAQFPVVPAYAITIHKSQGVTLDQVVLELGDEDFTPGLTYVAISRVKTLAGLMFNEAFDYMRICPAVTAGTRMRDRDHRKRGYQLIVPAGAPPRSSPPPIVDTFDRFSRDMLASDPFIEEPAPSDFRNFQFTSDEVMPDVQDETTITTITTPIQQHSAAFKCEMCNIWRPNRKRHHGSGDQQCEYCYNREQYQDESPDTFKAWCLSTSSHGQGHEVDQSWLVDVSSASGEAMRYHDKCNPCREAESLTQ